MKYLEKQRQSAHKTAVEKTTRKRDKHSYSHTNAPTSRQRKTQTKRQRGSTDWQSDTQRARIKKEDDNIYENCRTKKYSKILHKYFTSVTTFSMKKS